MPNNQLTARAVVNGSAAPTPNQLAKLITLVDVNGNVLNVPKKAAAQVDSVATTVAGLVTDFNALLAKLRAAGVMS